MVTSILFGILMFAVALFLILLILVQRGRGGGLSGALGGMGGQSAFGTKAGDLFTRITIVVAAVWILLCIAVILVMNPQLTRGTGTGGAAALDYTESSGDRSTPPPSPTGSSGAKSGAGPAEAPPSPAPSPGGTK
jgi:preprotein translocase subunit SecG